MRMNPMKWSGALVGLSLALGCAGAQKTAPRSATTAEDEVPLARAGGRDEVAAVAAAAPKEQITLSEDARADFEKAVANYQRLKKGGLKGGDCDDAASAFRKIADRNPQLLIARHNEASVYQECGREKEAMRIWDEL